MERYRVEEMALYESIIENYPGSVLVADNTGRVIFCNQGSMELSGRRADELIGWSIYDLRQQKVLGRSVLIEALESGQTTIRYLLVGDDDNNGVLAIGIPVFGQEGRLAHVIAFSQVDRFAQISYAWHEEEMKQLRQLFHSLQNFHHEKEFVAASPRMRELLQFAEGIQNMTEAVLISGELGAGKGALARHIHRYSPLADQMFLPVHCAAVPKELMEVTLFGYEKGGVHREGKLGLLELAYGGTLYLEEISELPLNLQSKLLHVLETGEFKRVGGKEIKPAKVRVIASTSRDLLELVRRGDFREDLYYRLNVISLCVPPLRERPEDVEPLISFFTAKFNQKYGLSTQLVPQIKERLRQYSWPGNVRELKQVVERLVLLGGKQEGTEGGWGLAQLFRLVESFQPPGGEEISYRAYMSAAEREYLTRMLELCRGNVRKMSAKTGLHISGLYRKMEEHGIEPKQYRKKV